MEIPGTSAGLKKLCVSANNLEENNDIDGNPSVYILDQDEGKLLAIFPEEIWRKTVGAVNRPSLESVNNASSFFHRLLYPERQLFLFSPVWKILGAQYEVDSDPVYCDLELKDGDLNKAREDEYLPTHSVILKLRLVCREWCLAINKFYEDLYHNYDPKNEDSKDSVIKPRVESGLDSADEQAINRRYWSIMGSWSQCKLDKEDEDIIPYFLEHFAATHDSQTNPFPFRKVTFHPGRKYGAHIVNYWSNVIELLTKYGHHIWFCDVTFSNETNLVPEFNVYIKIGEILSLMPNLKVLRFALDDNHELDDAKKNQIMGAMVSHPIPRLDNLTFVSFGTMPRFLIKNLLENNSQVNKIEIWRLEQLNFADIHLPNLTQLVIRFENLREFEMFENCGPQWRLNMLHVDVLEWVPYPRIYKCLEQWKESLTDVDVNFPWADEATDQVEIVRNSGIPLDLPHVTRLRIRLCNIMSLDLILPMTDLELLELYPDSWEAWEWEKVPKDLVDTMKTNEIIEFHSLREDEDMYNSNIWKIFRKLRRIHVLRAEYIFGGFKCSKAYTRQKVKTWKRQESDIQNKNVSDTVISKSPE